MAALALPIGIAAAASITVVVDYDPALGELPEGVAVDKTGNVFVTLAPLGRIEKITPAGTRSTYAQVAPPGVGLGPLGLAVDAPGNVYAAVSTLDPATRGVYRVARDGTSERLPGTGAIVFPNGLTFDKRGTLYVTDTIPGVVWRIPRGGAAEALVLVAAARRRRLGGFSFPIGANRIAYRHNAVAVGNTEGARVVQIPIEPDGSAGAATVLADGPAFFGADGMAYDAHGDLWLAVIAQSTIVRISPSEPSRRSRPPRTAWTGPPAWPSARAAASTRRSTRSTSRSASPGRTGAEPVHARRRHSGTARCRERGRVRPLRPRPPPS